MEEKKRGKGFKEETGSWLRSGGGKRRGKRSWGLGFGGTVGHMVNVRCDVIDSCPPDVTYNKRKKVKKNKKNGQIKRGTFYIDFFFDFSTKK